MSETMSLTRALTTKKHLKDQIDKQISKFVPTAILIGQNSNPPGYKSIEDFTEFTKSKWQQLQDNMTRLEKIVLAIADANSKISIEVGKSSLESKVISGGDDNSTITIAQALSLKELYSNIFMKVVERLRDRCVSDKEQIEETSLIETEKSNREFSDFINKDKGVSEEDAKAMQRIIALKHEVKYIDPIGLEKVVDALVKKYEEFLNEIDISLSEVNSRNEITIS